MEAANTTEAFSERIRAMTNQLRERLSQDTAEESTAVGEMLDDLYKQGAELGLTNNEIVRQLIAPVADLLRPGLTR